MKYILPGLLFVLMPALAASQQPLGPPIPVNIPTPVGFVELSSLAMNARGEFVVTWVRDPVHAGDLHLLVARRFTADGRPVRGEIVVDDQPESVNPSQVLVQDDGSFVVILNNSFPALTAFRYDAGGAFLGESQVVERASATDFRVAPLMRGGFVLTWVRDDICFARIFDANAEPVGPERRVGPGDRPAVAPEPDGGFVVTWVGEKPTDDPRFSDPYIVAQRFDATGEREGGRILVQSVLETGLLYTNEVATDAAGNFMTLWMGALNNGPNPDGTFARRFAPDGAPLTARLRVEGRDATGSQLAMDRAGDFVVAWGQSIADPIDSPHAFAQRFSANGRPLDRAFRVDPVVSGNPLVASDARGNFVVVFPTARQIFARLYRGR